MGSPVSILAFSFLIYFTAMKDIGVGILNHKFLVFMGEASYSLYIFQVPLKTLFQQIYSKILNGGDTSGPLYAIYLSVTLILCSCLLFHYFEMPLNKILSNKSLNWLKER